MLGVPDRIELVLVLAESFKAVNVASVAEEQPGGFVPEEGQWTIPDTQRVPYVSHSEPHLLSSPLSHLRGGP